MAASRTREFPVCPSDALPELGRYSFPIRYRGQPAEAIAVRFEGTVYGYLNLCVHMPRRLDCEGTRVFDDTGRFLRCTMHGIVYDPVTGECQSEICAGQSLTPLRIVERDGTLYLIDKRAEPLAPEDGEAADA